MCDKIINLNKIKREKELLILIKRLRSLIVDLKFQRLNLKFFDFNLLKNVNNSNNSNLIINLYRELQPKRYLELYESLLTENNFDELKIFSNLLNSIIAQFPSVKDYYDTNKKYFYYITKDKDIDTFNKYFIEIISKKERCYNTIEEIMEYCLRVYLLKEFSSRILIETIDENFYFILGNDIELSLYECQMKVKKHCITAYNRLMNICDKDCRDICFHLLCEHGNDDIKHVTLKERFALICGEFNI